MLAFGSPASAKMAEMVEAAFKGVGRHDEGRARRVHRQPILGERVQTAVAADRRRVHLRRSEVSEP
jgi:hypothetical protein